MNSQAARFFLYEKWFKSWKKAEKKGKIKRKKLQKIFCLGASTWREEMPLIKVAYFMLNFLNLKSFLSHLFFWVASCLSTLCCKIFEPHRLFSGPKNRASQGPCPSLFVDLHCRENPVIFTDFPCNPPAICKYSRVFPADIA